MAYGGWRGEYKRIQYRAGGGGGGCQVYCEEEKGLTRWRGGWGGGYRSTNMNMR